MSFRWYYPDQVRRYFSDRLPAVPGLEKDGSWPPTEGAGHGETAEHPDAFLTNFTSIWRWFHDERFHVSLTARSPYRMGPEICPVRPNGNTSRRRGSTRAKGKSRTFRDRCSLRLVF
ncbi:hypothetical protein HYQ46_010915 [Verticillium longisporum]|nr:hypothetical protein HYQ46_010915 [Verticillium longisporum]